MPENIQSFFTTQSLSTSPGDFVYLYTGIQPKLNEAYDAVHNCLFHLAQVDTAEPAIDSLRIKHNLNIYSAENILAIIASLDNRSLYYPRLPDHRYIGICAHYSLLLCSLLRHFKIPCRMRCGFETQSTESHHDHWLCEYWNDRQKLWIRLDPELSPILSYKWDLGYDPLSIPEDVFMTGSEAWLICHSEKNDPNSQDCDVAGWTGGRDFVLANLVFDFLALNKIELSPWDDLDIIKNGYDALTTSQIDLMYRIAQAGLAVNNDHAALIKLFLDNQDLFT